ERAFGIAQAAARAAQELLRYPRARFFERTSGRPGGDAHLRGELITGRGLEHDPRGEPHLEGGEVGVVEREAFASGEELRRVDPDVAQPADVEGHLGDGLDRDAVGDGKDRVAVLAE